MPILALYAGILSFILIYLSYQVANNRHKFKVGIGDGDNETLSRVIRVHANFIEYVPIALILIAIFETNHGHPVITHMAGSVLVVARLMHAYGLAKSAGKTIGRFGGTMLTWIVLLGMAGVNIYYYVALSMR